MQQSMNRFDESCRDFGLTISTSKTEVMLQPAPPQPYSESQIIVDGDTLKAFDDFSYLDRTLSTSVNIDSEVDKRIAKAGSTFGRIRASVRDRKGITLKTKLKVYRAAVLPTLSHACEIWTVYECHAKTKNKQKKTNKQTTKRLDRFYISCLRKLLKPNWKARVPDTNVLVHASMTSV